MFDAQHSKCILTSSYELFRGNLLVDRAAARASRLPCRFAPVPSRMSLQWWSQLGPRRFLMGDAWSHVWLRPRMRGEVAAELASSAVAATSPSMCRLSLNHSRPAGRVHRSALQHGFPSAATLDRRWLRLDCVSRISGHTLQPQQQQQQRPQFQQPRAALQPGFHGHHQPQFQQETIFSLKKG